MRFSIYKIVVLALLIAFVGLSAANAEIPSAEATQSLPDKVGPFRSRGPASVPAQAPNDHERLSFAVRTYTAPSGKTYVVDISKTRSPSAAYALLTAARGSDSEIKLGVVGTAIIVAPSRVLFIKGSNFVGVSAEGANVPSADEMIQLGNGIAQPLDGENEIPVLVKHLPAWERVGLNAYYAVTVDRLKGLIPDQPILDAVSFEGGAEAVVAQYDTGRLAIVEFNTPQIATSNDRNIAAKFNELKGAVPPVGTPLPSAYRRVGNYSVFVFDAPSEQTANQLIDQVKYQQIVRWLGDNPFAYERATREFTETTLGVFVAVVKASGLAVLACLAVGGLFGALLFGVRRSQQRAKEAYADSDAMLRLNLDDLTPERDPARLLGRRN
ncbi:MAG: hypothetical protein LC775_14675 [Acidobacteria bacterium]|nr:hypothetical protein [Acidobacteriota bacterium]